jgi:hypothetical protein
MYHLFTLFRGQGVHLSRVVELQKLLQDALAHLPQSSTAEMAGKQNGT